MPPRIPTWIFILSLLIALLGLFVGCSLYLTPGTFIKDVDFASPGARYLASMWAARQITLGAIIGIALFRRSVPMLQLALGAYSIMNLQDLAIGLNRGDAGLAIGASIFMLGPAFMAYRLSKA